jgi:hypothetical protein
MPICERCHYYTEKLCNLKKHLNRKTVCDATYSSISRELLLLHINDNTRNYLTNYICDTPEHVFNCKYCKNTYKSQSSKYRHQRDCKHKHAYEENLERQRHTEILIAKLHEQVKELMEENNLGTVDTIDLSANNNGNIAGNDVNLQNIQNNQINNINNSKKVNINNYGDEDISHITDQDFKEMIEDPYNAMSRLMNAIHFNDLKPENQNLRIPNIKNPFIEIFKDGIWVFGNQYKLLCKAYTTKKEILHNAFLRIEHQLDEKTKRIYYEYKEAADSNLFTVESQLTDIKATIISGTRHKPPVPSRYALRQTCCSKKNIKENIAIS